MSTDDHDEAMTRLRAADPARGAGGDLDALRHAVELRVGSPAETVRSGEDHEDELVDVRERRRTRRVAWLAVASVAAVGFGAGGYAIGASGSGPTDPAPVVADPFVATEEQAAPQIGVAQDTAGGRETLLAGSGRTVFTADAGLSTAGGSVEAYGYDATAVFTEGTAAAVAAALGMSQEPRLVDGVWMVGSWEDGGAVLQVFPDGTTSVSYNDPALDPWGCAVVAEAGAARSEGADGAGGAPDAGIGEEPQPCEPGAQDPAPADALEQAQAVLTEMGVDTSAYDWTTEESVPNLTNVNGTPNVGGADAGAGWNVTVVADGIASIWGNLAPLHSLGSYQTISPAAAVERLMDPRFGGALDVMPFMAVDDAGVAAEAGTTGPADAPVSSDPPSVPGTPEPGAAIQWPVRQVTITSASPSLMPLTQADGATLLVPAYRLSDAGGSVWTVIAVADGHLDFQGS